jgi:hypothetical protein
MPSQERVNTRFMRQGFLMGFAIAGFALLAVLCRPLNTWNTFVFGFVEAVLIAWTITLFFFADMRDDIVIAKEEHRLALMAKNEAQDKLIAGQQAELAASRRLVEFYKEHGGHDSTCTCGCFVCRRQNG